MLEFLILVKNALGGWRGVVLASLLLAASVWLGFSRLDNKRLKAKVAKLEQDAVMASALIDAQNKAVEEWKAQATAQTVISAKAQESQVKLAQDYRRDLAARDKRLQMTGQCEPDVDVAAQEFKRQAGGQ